MDFGAPMRQSLGQDLTSLSGGDGSPLTRSVTESHGGSQLFDIFCAGYRLLSTKHVNQIKLFFQEKFSVVRCVMRVHEATVKNIPLFNAYTPNKMHQTFRKSSLQTTDKCILAARNAAVEKWNEKIQLLNLQHLIFFALKINFVK